jgi:hypothetical protein
MKYRDRTTGQLYELFELRDRYANISLPINWDTSTYDFLNVDPVRPTAPPSVGALEQLEYLGAVYEDNQWVERWSVVPISISAEELNQLAEENRLEKWRSVRERRNQLLAASDYTEFLSVPISSACRANFQAYRQKLRDVTNQPDPYNIIWPTEPPYERA